MGGVVGEVRAVALVGPNGSGKTTLLEALAAACDPAQRTGQVDHGTSLGDASPEARARRQSTEVNHAQLSFLGDRFAIADCPGSVHFAHDADHLLAAVDLALVVVDPDPARAALVQPILRRLEALGVPRALFVNKIDTARGRVRDLLDALAPMSAAPLVARQIPIRDGERVTGFVDLALERAFAYRAQRPAERIALPDALAEREQEARFHMLEQLAEHDDTLLEALVDGVEPSAALVFADLQRELAAGQIAPVFFGSASNGFGVRRLLKALRHDTPAPAAAAARTGGGTHVIKLSHAAAVGKLAIARVFEPGGGGEGAAFALHGGETAKLAKVERGAIVAIAKVDARAGSRLGAAAPAAAPEARPVVALVVEPRDRKDDVRLSGALVKLVEEDGGLSWTRDAETGAMLLGGVSDEHLRLALDRLLRRYGVAVESHAPPVGYRETVRRAAHAHARHKKQSGGHGQFADVSLEIAPAERGAGFAFASRVTGGAVPKQYIPAVEAGARDACLAGPLGFPVIDIVVTLTDGAAHSVDSSELAFRTAGRMAVADALRAGGPLLLEPFERLTLMTPATATARLASAISGHRGHILGFEPREGWHGWDKVEALLPKAELQALAAEARAQSQGLATIEAVPAHLAELNGKLAEEVTRAKEAA